MILTVLGIISAIAVPGSMPVLDSAAVEAASWQTESLFALARDHAIASGHSTAVSIDSATRRITVHAATDTIASGNFAESHVSISSSRDSMSYSPAGIGIGGANLSIRLSKGKRTDTITVSRLGRVSRR